ncbi:peptidyl-tRNA hydrolase, partial [bacterium]|nr:peptidyl-tRNA hydrolase [bacterium]
MSERPPLEPRRCLIVGLGNPGKRYQYTRHNLGFLALERLAEERQGSFTSKRCHAETAVATWGHTPVLLAKPQTYMNLSGQAVAGLMAYYRIDLDRLLVVLDDNDLPLGRLRL